MNAHPHTDSSGKIAIVHNGTISNANELRDMLKRKGHKFTSQTDTEVIAKLIGDTYERIKKDDNESYLRAAVEESMAKCEGTWVSWTSVLQDENKYRDDRYSHCHFAWSLRQRVWR